jgi:flagellar motor component MotA
MLKILVSYALGPWGLKVLFYIIDNSAIIMSIVFAYGLFLVVAHNNFSKILNHLIDQFNAQLGNKRKKGMILIDIEKAIAENKKFPFVSGQLSIIARKVNKENVTRFLNKEAKWVKLVKDVEISYI